MRKLCARIVLWLIAPALARLESEKVSAEQARQVLDAVLARALSASVAVFRPSEESPGADPDTAPPLAADASEAEWFCSGRMTSSSSERRL